MNRLPTTRLEDRELEALLTRETPDPGRLAEIAATSDGHGKQVVEAITAVTDSLHAGRQHDETMASNIETQSESLRGLSSYLGGDR